MSGLSAAKADEIARGAIAWVKGVSASTKKSLELDKAKLLAAEEYDGLEYLTRIVVADKARAMLRAVNRAIRSGKVGREWGGGTLQDALDSNVTGKFSPKTAFLTTLQSALNAGVWQQGQADPNIVFVLYHTMLDEAVRLWHRPLEAVCLPKDHPFWDTHTPPNGPNCRCTIELLTRAEFEALKGDKGVNLQTEAPDEPLVEYVNKATGERELLPRSVSPGYDLNPGTKAGTERFRSLLEQRLRILVDAPDDAL